VQIYGCSKEVAPERLDAEARRALRSFIEDQGLVLSAVCGDIGNFMDPAKNPDRIGRAKRIVDMALDLGTPVVTTHIGTIPADVSSPVYKTLQAACRELGRYASAQGATFAIETGPETAAVLGGFLDALDVKGMGVNLDPANLVMVCRDDPVAAVATLAPYIIHTHAKDGRNLKPCNPAEVYAAFDDCNYPDLEKLLGGAPFAELPLGEGDVPWKPYLDALSAVGYRGFLTLEREEGADRYGDIARGVQFLKSFLFNKEKFNPL
jgi:sugar phosphate isomerase/epimerase